MDNIRNLGPIFASWLREVSVSTIDDLWIRGSVGTYLDVKRS